MIIYSFLKEPPTFYFLQAPLNLNPSLTQHLSTDITLLIYLQYHPGLLGPQENCPQFQYPRASLGISLFTLAHPHTSSLSQETGHWFSKAGQKGNMEAFSPLC